MQDPFQTYELMEALNELEEVEFAEPNHLAFALGAETMGMPIALSMPAIPSMLMPEPEDDGGKTGDYHNTWAYTHSPLYPLQWGLQAVHLPELWAADNNNNDERAIIAILDTGIDIEHPDLAANIWTNAAEASGAEGEDDDNNGFADEEDGEDDEDNEDGEDA